MRLFEETTFRFVQSRYRAYVVSAVLLTLGVASLITRGLELGIDFRGGMEFVIETGEDIDATAVRNALGSRIGQTPEVKTYGSGALLVRTLGGVQDVGAIEQPMLASVTDVAPSAIPKIVKTDVVGPRFAADLKRGAIYSVLGSLLVIFAYSWIRFEWMFGVGAVVALFHDVLITLGVFSMLHGLVPFSLQVDQVIIAAFLTIVGYSLNDTVVIFDRIREYSNLFKTEPYETMVNRAINRTMSRTVVTSGTTLLVVLTLFIFGGDVLKGFSFALIFGVLIGTYSSIFVATPVVVDLKTRFAAKR